MELVVENLCKSYGKKEALKTVSFSLSPGLYGLLGPNGSGKSTLMNILTGNITASSGTVKWNGQDVKISNKAYRSILGYVPQHQALYPEFTAERFLAYISTLQGMGKKNPNERINYVLDRVGLAEVRRKKIKTFSGGMKQRLLIAQSLLDEPELLIMDEPTANLDPKQRVLVRELFSQISQERIIIIATHIVSDVEPIASEFLLLRNGALIRKGHKEELIADLDSSAAEGDNTLTMEDVYLHYFGGQYNEADLL